MTPYPESHFLLQRHTHAPPQAHQTVTHIQSTSIEAHSGKDKPSLLQIETLKSFSVRVCRDTKAQKKSSNAPRELLSCLLIHAKSERNKFNDLERSIYSRQQQNSAIHHLILRHHYSCFLILQIDLQ